MVPNYDQQAEKVNDKKVRTISMCAYAILSSVYVFLNIREPRYIYTNLCEQLIEQQPRTDEKRYNSYSFLAHPHVVVLAHDFPRNCPGLAGSYPAAGHAMH